MDEVPEREASAKVAQHLAAAVQVAEVIFRMRQQAADRQARGDQVDGGAARAERGAQHAADRLRWTPALEPEWTKSAGLTDLGRAWSSAAGWADTDPAAEVAATRVESRLADLAPNAMARFDELRQDGWTRVDAMRDVLPALAAEDQLRSQEPRVFVTEPAARTADAAYAQSRADGVRADARVDLARPDDRSTPLVDEHAEGVAVGRVERAEGGAWQAAADAATADARDDRGRRLTSDGRTHPADLAAEAYPQPYTQVRPMTPPPTVPSSSRGTAAARTLTRTR